MASNFKALPEKNMRRAPENRDMPLPLLDLSDAAVKELIRSAKKRGYVTVDEIGIEPLLMQEKIDAFGVQLPQEI